MPFAGQRLDDVAAVRNENNVIAIVRSGFGADAGEQVGEFVILFVGPFLHRMVVAFGAVDGHAEERLGRRLGHQARVFVQDIKITGAVFERAALRGEDFPDEDIPGRVGGDVVPNPVVIRPHGGGFQLLALDQQQVGPFVSPVINELRALQQRFDELVALL